MSLRIASCWSQIAQLELELLTVTWQYTASGSKIEIVGKQQMARLGIPSPDHADALAYSYHSPVRIDFKTGILIGGQREGARS